MNLKTLFMLVAVVSILVMPVSVSNIHWTDVAVADGQPASQLGASDTIWDIQCVDCSKDISGVRERSLRLDSDGRPHIVYGGDRLYYAWHDGTQWHYETVDEAPGVGAHTSLALDQLERPRVSYYDATNQDLKYAWYDGSAWHSELVDSAGDVGMYTSLALDSLQRPHISYYGNNAGTSSLRYAWHDGATWHIETAHSSGGTTLGMYSSLALDEDNHPHISYYHYVVDFMPYVAAGRLEYAWHDGATWHIETVDGNLNYGETGLHTSLALDTSGRPHISYHDKANNKLKYAWHDGTSWQTATLDDQSQGRGYTSLALDTLEFRHYRSGFGVCR